MKKQILFLVVFVLAAFAGINKSYGQACAESLITPSVGKSYTYATSITSSPGGTGGTYVWKVTKQTEFVAGTAEASGTDFTATFANSSSASIVWNSPSVGQTFYLVVKYTETVGTCTVENLKAWKIDPISNFLLAITYSGSDSQCSPAIASANVAGTTVTYDYGDITMIAEITASNYVGTWTPSFQITGLATGQTISNASWGTTVTGGTALTFSGGVATAVANSATAAFDGTSKIYLKFTIENNSYELLNADQTIAIAVDGVTSGGKKDVLAVDDCTEAGDWVRTHDQTIKPRPTLTATDSNLN